MIPVGPAQVHLWCCSTEIGVGEFATRHALLSEQERARAARFHDRTAMVAFTAAHGWLRRVLGAYVNVPPEALRFGEGAHGKPQLALASGGTPRVSFNLSHSGDLAIVAVAEQMAVGVDIEHVRPMPRQIAEDSFAPGEAAALANVAPAERDSAFMRLWTRKEAYLKATGTGLNTPLDAFEVSLDEPARLLRVRSDPAEAACWQIAHLEPAPGYCGAVAARGQGWTCVWMARPGATPLLLDPKLNAAPNPAYS